LRHSTERILVSHGGNLPRPPDMEDVLRGAEFLATPQYRRMIPEGVQWVASRQIEFGIDIVNDGEYGKAGSYTGYMQERVSGWESRPSDPSKPLKRGRSAERDRRDFPGVFASGLWNAGSGGPIRPGFVAPGRVPQGYTGVDSVCTGPVRYTGQAAIEADIANLKTALNGTTVEGFLTSLGPLGLGARAWNEHYPSEDDYMIAVAEAVREEYKAIADAGFIVQVDEPEFFTTWQFYPEWDVNRYRKYLHSAVELINHALHGLPEELVRFHACWGSGHRPHVNDIDLPHIADLLVKINAQTYAIEAGNVRHAHEWQVWKDVKLPDGKMLMPGVISHATDLVEHPELVAERLECYAGLIGKENVQAGTDCGIGSRVGHEEIAWAKLRTMAVGAAIASKRLWGRR
jgi:5-methyltetrahydropteroyltriglutamate--homocysteine methyltransferase